jgi:SAM-dependent methyltransferase
MESTPNWDSRAAAIQRWRRPSALMGRAVTEAIVADARVETGMSVLDVASGTGEPAISIATQLRGTGRVVATDLSPDSLKVGEERACERGLANIEFRIADAHALPFPDVSFDRITSRLGIMFFSDLPRALTEMHRVLRPNGRVSLLAWGPVEQPYFDTMVGTILRTLPELQTPALGLRMFRFGVPGTLTAALKEAGFCHTAERLQRVTWDWEGTPEDLWEYFQHMTVPFASLMEAIPPHRRREVDNAVIAALAPRYDGEQVRFQAEVVLASAERSANSPRSSNDQNSR